MAQVRESLNDDGPDQFLGRHRARRLLANELKGEEPREAYRTINGLAFFLPIATIDAKIRIAERIAAGDVHFLAE